MPGRRDELLDGVMAIIAARGFSDVKVNDIASELRCSLASLYKIAPNKDSLIVLAIGRWGDLTLAKAEASARGADTASEQAQRYYHSAAESVARMSHAFRRDMERFESAHLAYMRVSDAFVNRFAGLVEQAMHAGEIHEVNARFMAGLFRHMAAAIRDEDLLEAADLTASEALLQIDAIIWRGLRCEK
jgi:AcrR family transcriptional regulator